MGDAVSRDKCIMSRSAVRRMLSYARLYLTCRHADRNGSPTLVSAQPQLNCLVRMKVAT